MRNIRVDLLVVSEHMYGFKFTTAHLGLYIMILITNYTDMKFMVECAILVVAFI